MTSAYGSYLAGFEPKSGYIYLVEERRPKLSYELFDQIMTAGYSGLVVTRDFPKKLLTENELGTCKVLWLTNLIGEGRINPTAIGILMGQIRTFIENQQKSVIIIDGFEYLASTNTYDRMLQFMNQLRDIVVTNDCILFVPLDPRTLNPRELAMLERSMEPIMPKSEADQGFDNMLNPQDEGVLRLLDVHPR